MENTETPFAYDKIPKKYLGKYKNCVGMAKGWIRARTDVRKGSKDTHSQHIQWIGGRGFCWLRGLCALFTHPGRLFAISSHNFPGSKKKEEQTAKMVKWSAIADRISIFGTPEILMVGKDSRFTGGFQDFYTSRNVIFQTATPWNHQSLGSTERRHRFSGRLSIMSLVKENRKFE